MRSPPPIGVLFSISLVAPAHPSRHDYKDDFGSRARGNRRGNGPSQASRGLLYAAANSGAATYVVGFYLRYLWSQPNRDRRRLPSSPKSIGRAGEPSPQRRGVLNRMSAKRIGGIVISFVFVAAESSWGQTQTLRLGLTQIITGSTGLCTVGSTNATSDSTGVSFPISVNCAASPGVSTAASATGTVRINVSAATISGQPNGQNGLQLSSPITITLSAPLTITPGNGPAVLLIEDDTNGNPGKQCDDFSPGPVTCTLGTIAYDGSQAHFRADVDFSFNGGGTAAFEVLVYYTATVGQSSDLDDSAFTADPGPGSSCAAPTGSASSHERVLSPRIANPVLTAVAGSTIPATGTVSVICKTNCSGGIPFTVTVTPQTGGNWLSVTTPNGTTVNGSTPVPLRLSADASKLSAASSPYTAFLTVSGNFASSPLISTVKLNVLAPDSISLTGDQPAGTALDPAQPQNFRTVLNYVLSSRCSANLALIAYDDTGNELARSTPPYSVNFGPAATTELSISGVTLSASVKSVTLKADFLDTATAQPFLVSNNALVYTIGGQISITLALPFPTDPLFATSQQLPSFCASGTYTYTGKNQARVALQLLDAAGNLLGLGFSGNLQAGSGNWGGNCVDPAQLIFIPAERMPTFPIPSPLTTANYNTVVGTLQLQAVLEDSLSLADLAHSSPVVYQVEPGAAATSQLFLRKSDGTSVPVPPSLTYVDDPRFDIAAELANSLTVDFAYNQFDVDVTLDLAGSSGILDVIATTVDSSNQAIGALSARSRLVTAGHGVYTIKLDGQAPPGTVAIGITPRLTLASGSAVLFEKINLNFETIAIQQLTPAPSACGIPTLQKCLTVGDTNLLGQPNSIQVNGLVVAGSAGEQVVRLVFIVSDRATSTTQTTLTGLGTLPIQTPTAFTDIISLNKIPNDIRYIQIRYQLHNATQPLAQGCSSCATVEINYESFAYPQLIQLGAQAANALYPFISGAFGQVGLRVPAAITNIRLGLNAADFALSHPEIASSVAAGLQLFGVKERGPQTTHRLELNETPHLGAVAARPPVIGIASGWTFDPPIPHDGSFSATITLNYSPTDLPDDPNFVESKMQVVSFDASGTMHAYPTTVDTVNKVATATIDGLDPYFSLAVEGPFNQASAMLAAIPTGYALVNTGKQDSNLSLTGYVNGSGTPLPFVLQAGRQQSSTAPGWLQVWADSAGVAGVSWFDNGAQFAVAPASTPGSAFLFTDIEYNTLKSTEIDLANTSTLDQEIAVLLFRGDGSVQGTYTRTLSAKTKLTSPIEGLFPSIPVGFIGYAVAVGQQTLTAAAFQWTNTTATDIAAQPINDASLTATTLYVPQLGGTRTVSHLHLVNSASTKANVTLTAWTTSGTLAAAVAQVQLTPGQQYTAAITDLFGIDPNTAGSIEVDTDTPGLFGDVLTIDSSFFPAYAISIPLTRASNSSTVLPYATAHTTAYVFNPSSIAASVTVTPYGADGTAGSPSSALVPAKGRAAIAVNANAYATIVSNQPVVASGWMITASGSTTGYLAMPGSATTTGGEAGARPQIGSVVNAGSSIAKLARGALGVIFGTNLSSSIADFGSPPLPNALAGTSVTVGGVTAPLLYASPTQINFQVPYEVALGSAVPVLVTSTGGVSDPASVTIADYAIGVFTYPRGPATEPIIMRSTTNALITPDNPAVPGESLVVYATGVGKLNNSPATGQAVAASPPSAAKDLATVTVGGASANVLFEQMAPFLVGVVQLKIQLPTSLPSGNLPLVISSPGDTSPPVNLPVGGMVLSAPSIGVAPASLDFSSVTVGQSKTLTITLSNNGSSALNVTTLSAASPFTVVSPTTPFVTAPGASVTVTIAFSPATAGVQNGALAIGSNDPVRPNVTVPLTGDAAPAASSVIFSDTFNRAAGGVCGFGQADLGLGGSGTHLYLPIFTSGASLRSGVLQNGGQDYGGIQFSTSVTSPCSGRGDDVGQDLNIRVDLMVPGDSAGHVSEAGPYLRSRRASPNDGIIGGSSSGYWVELLSTGQVRVKQLNPQTFIAVSNPPLSFDSAVFHTLEVAVQGNTLQAALDGQTVIFDVGATVSITMGANDGAAGVAFGDEENRGAIGGQSARNLVVSAYQALSGRLVAENLTIPASPRVDFDSSSSSLGSSTFDSHPGAHYLIAGPGGNPGMDAVLTNSTIADFVDFQTALPVSALETVH